MKVIYEPGGKQESCFIETIDSRIRCLMSTEEAEVITIEDSEDEDQAEDNQIADEIFPCGVSTGCNTSRKDNEPEHLLRCLLVKILMEIDTPSIHIEAICTSLSKRYDYFFTTPIYRLVQGIKDLIQIGDFLDNIRIVLDDNGFCFLLRTDWEVICLDSEEEMENIGEELKAEMLKYNDATKTSVAAVVAAPKPEDDSDVICKQLLTDDQEKVLYYIIFLCDFYDFFCHVCPSVRLSGIGIVGKGNVIFGKY